MGDMDCDGDADFDDIDCFMEALGNCPDPNYACLPCNCLNGDLDGDGDVDFFDIDPFTAAFGGMGLRTAYGWDAENPGAPGFRP